MDVSGQLHAPTRLTTGKMGLYPLTRGPGGLRSRSGPIGLNRNLSPLPGSNPESDVIFVCDTVQLFCVVFCVLRAVHIFDFKLAINDTHNKMVTSVFRGTPRVLCRSTAFSCARD